MELNDYLNHKDPTPLQLLDAKMKRGDYTPRKTYLAKDEYLDYGVNINDRRHLDDNFSFMSPYSASEIQADRQSGWNKSGSGLGRIATKVGTELFKIPGVVGGIGAGTVGQIGDLITGEDNTDFMETAFNNSWIKTLSELNEEINEEYLPVYVRKAVQDGNLWANISSIDFWATEGADGIGYIASMMFPGAALKALGAGNKLSKLPFLKGNVGAKQLDVINSTLANTILEAGAEAHHAMEGFQKKLDSQLQNREITVDEYNKLLPQKSKLGRDIFLSNSIILLGPNALQSQMLWGKSLSKSASKAFGSDGKVLDAAINPKWYQKVGNRGVDIIKGGAPEGLWEEGMQSAVENMFSDAASKGGLTDNFFEDFNIGELGNAYVDTISTTEGQKAMFLGAFLGGGMSAFSGAKSDIRDRKLANSLLESINPAIQDYHKLLTTEIYDESGKIIPAKVKERVEALQSLENIQSIYKESLEKQDKESLETLRELAGIQLAFNFINNEKDGLQFLEQYLNQSKEIIEVQEASKNTEKNATTIEETIGNIMENAKKMEKSKTDFDNFAYSLYDPQVKNEELQKHPELSNLLLSAFKKQLSNNYISNNILKDLYTKKLNKINPLYNQILNEKLDQEELKGNSRIKSDEQLQELIDSDIRLKNLQTENNELKSRIEEINNINDKFWDSKQIQKDFDTFLENQIKEGKETEESENLSVKLDEIFKSIYDAPNLEELEKIELDNNPLLKQAYRERKKELEKKEIDYRNKSEVLSKTPNSINKNVLEENEFKVGDEVLNPQTKKNSVVQEIGDKFLVLQDTETGDKTLIEINDAIITGSSNNEEFEPSENDAFSEDVDLENTTVSPSNEKNDFKSPGIDNDDPSYRSYVMTPRDKKGDEVTFSLNENSKLSEDSKKAIQIYKSGKDLAKHRDFLIRYLPIKFAYNNGEATSWSTFQGDRSGDIPKGVKAFRENLIDALIQGNNLESLVSFVTNQEQPSFNNKKETLNSDEGVKVVPVKNNVLEIDYIRDVLKGNVNDLTLFHVNNKGNFVKVSNNKKELKVNSFYGKTLMDSIGNIFVIIKSPTGNNVPVKLNINTINPGKASTISRMYKEILNNEDLLKSPIKVLNFNSSSKEQKELYTQILEILKLEINILNKENTTLEQVINFLIHTNSKFPNNSILIKKNTTDGSNYVEYKGRSFSLNTEESFNDFTKELSNKRQNIITVSNDLVPNINFKNSKYLEYLFKNNIITTDLETDPSENSFVMATTKNKKGSELWISSAISTTKQPATTDTANTVQQSSSNEDGVNKIMQDFDTKLKEKIKKIPKGEEVVSDKLLIYSPENNTIIESDMDVRYSSEGVIIQNEVVSYDQYKNLLRENIENNVRNIQKNSVSLQKEPKIENKVDIKGTPDNTIKEKEISNLDKELAKKEYDVLIGKIEAIKKNIETFSNNKNNNPQILSRLEKSLSDNIDQANKIASKHGFKKC